MALTDKLSAIGNAIRAKTGGTDMLTLDQMPTAIAGIQTGSDSGWDESTVKSLIERSSILNLTLPSDLTKIGKGAFYGCKYLKNITLPNTVTRIEDFAFTDCKFDTPLVNSVEEKTPTNLVRIYSFLGSYDSVQNNYNIISVLLENTIDDECREYILSTEKRRFVS